MKKVLPVMGIIMMGVIIGLLLFSIQGQEVTKEKTKVGVIFNGECDDFSWNQAHYEGIEKCVDSLNLQVTYMENVPEDERCTEYIERLIADGCEIIFCTSFGYGEYEFQVANEHPEIHFFHASGNNLSKNMSTYFGRIYQMRYLCGIIAGLQTETNEIGYVASFPISEVNRGINAFTLGVKSVNPDAIVHVQWTGSWSDDELTKTATEKLLENGKIDLIAMHTDSLEALRIAEERGIYSIGYNYDVSKSFPKTYLTAPIWHWDKYYEVKIRDCITGKIISDNYWEGVDTGIVDLAPLTDNVKAGTKEIIEKEYERIKTGELEVFYGTIYDNKGNKRVDAEENIADEALLNKFNWYVDGVEINED